MQSMLFNTKIIVLAGFIGGISITKETNNKKTKDILKQEPLPHISLFDSINQIAYVADPNTYEILYVNKYFEQLLGENPVGKKCYEAFQNLQHPCSFCTNEEILKEKGEPYEWEYYNPLLKKDLLITDRIIRWHDGRDVRFEFAIDITSLKQKVKNLRKREERYRLAQKAGEIGTWDWDIITGDLIWSDQIEPIFGYKKDEFDKTYKAFLDCIHPDDRERVKNAINASLDKDEEYDIEHRILWPNKSVHWVREIGDVVRDKDGKAVRMLGIVQDITERKNNEEKIKKLNEDLFHRTIELELINNELEAFSYSVSHDLRAPLRSIDGFSQALLEDYADKLDDEGKDYLNRVRNASQHMGRIINDLLKLSRITRRPLETEQINISDLSQSIMDSMKEKDSDRKVKFRIDEDLAAIGDKQLIYMALENLIGNAWKFTSKKPSAKIEVGKTRKNNKDVFFVKDNGAGFNMKYADKLFTPFQRLHSDEEFPGTGIGLGIVTRIIHRHGGKIWAEGKEGEGATFYFSLREGRN